jgi:hypothetical protein
MLDDLKSQLGSSIQTVRRFLQRPVSVARGNLTLGVPASSLRAQAREEKRRHLRLMAGDLNRLFGQHPASRQLMRHLDLVERTLRRGGVEALETLPVRVIRKALDELERLVWDWSPAGLAELRSRMAVMVKTRPAETRTETAMRESQELDTVHDADVTEVEHAMYEATERSWAGTRPDAVASGLGPNAA